MQTLCKQCPLDLSCKYGQLLVHSLLGLLRFRRYLFEDGDGAKRWISPLRSLVVTIVHGCFPRTDYLVYALKNCMLLDILLTKVMVTCPTLSPVGINVGYKHILVNILKKAALTVNWDGWTEQLKDV